MKETEKLSFKESVEAFKTIASDAEALQLYAMTRGEVILPLIEAESTIRAIFTPEVLPPGAQATYDIPFDDVECVWVMPQIGGIPQVQLEGSEMYVNTFGIDGAVEWQMDLAKQGRFQVGQRATMLLKNKFIEQEELAGWTLIHAHASVLPDTQVVTLGVGQGLDIDAFNQIITKGDILRRKITDLYVSPKRFADMRDWVKATDLSNNMKDNAYTAEGMKSVWGVNIHKVYNQDLVSDDKAYAFGQRDGYTYGVMPIRETLQTYANPISIMEWKIGVMGREVLGFGVLDDKGLIEVNFR